MWDNAHEVAQHVPAVRRYLEAFLSSEDVPEALEDTLKLAARWSDRELDDLLRDARFIRASLTSAPVGMEAAVLVDEVGLSPDEAARILSMDRDDVVLATEISRQLSLRAERNAVRDDDIEGRAGAEPPGDEDAVKRSMWSSRRARTRPIAGVVVLLGLVVVAVAVIVLVDRQPRGALRSLEVVQAVLTSSDSADAASHQASFEPAERIVLRVTFGADPARGERHIDLVITRDGEPLLSVPTTLPATQDQLVVALPSVHLREPGVYRVLVRSDDRTLVQRTFIIQD